MDQNLKSQPNMTDLDIFQSNSNRIVKTSKNRDHTYIIKKWSRFHRFFYRAMNPLMSGIVPRFFRFETFGIENLNKLPQSTPLIFAANHRSHLDGLAAFTTVFPPIGNRRYLTTISQGSVLNENILFRLMRYLGAYPIDKNNPQKSLDYLYESLKAGLPIGLFPQGGRIARTPVEDYQRFSKEGRSGVGRLVLQTKGKVPILPAYIHGTAEALSKGSLIPKIGSYLSVTIGKPVYFKEYEDQEWNLDSPGFYDKARIVTDEIMGKIKELCFETEKGLFKLIEKKLNLPIDKINLSEKQSKALQKWLRRFSHYSPQEISLAI